jgi:hypothetical protein
MKSRSAGEKADARTSRMLEFDALAQTLKGMTCPGNILRATHNTLPVPAGSTSSLVLPSASMWNQTTESLNIPSQI